MCFLLTLFDNNKTEAEELEVDKSEQVVAPASTIRATKYVEIEPGYSFPSRIWHTRGNYGGYLTIESWERTPNFTYLGKYTGYLRYMAAPARVEDES